MKPRNKPTVTMVINNNDIIVHVQFAVTDTDKQTHAYECKIEKDQSAHSTCGLGTFYSNL